jgi:hypothetical protein
MQQQAEMIAQAQRRSPNRRPLSFAQPATAGPMHQSFDLGAVAANAQLRRGSQPLLDNVPMTAGLNGKFGGRSPNGSGRYSDDESDGLRAPPPTASRIISGGTSLGGGMPASTGTIVLNQAASKADGATSWRRGGASNSVLQRSDSPSVKVTPPPSERTTPPPVTQAPTTPVARTRPQPLQFNLQKLPAVAVIDTDAADSEDAETGSSASERSSPVTPQSAPPLSPREEASRKLYEGLGIGRPAPGVVPATPATATVARILSQAVRMPRGPPSGADELGPKNFASRIRRKAIGGLGALLDARERREVEAF